ncbi:MAG: hypothetical protein E7191_02520 [Erysipelotrichaceae bacterium]|nr:hypothetical protein [Erysipelotrichaceae bacterium]
MLLFLFPHTYTDIGDHMVHISQKYIRIEEYISLVSIQDSILEIQDKHTLIKIIGQDLKITALNSEEIVIEGKIQEVIFP